MIVGYGPCRWGTWERVLAQFHGGWDFCWARTRGRNSASAKWSYGGVETKSLAEDACLLRDDQNGQAERRRDAGRGGEGDGQWLVGPVNTHLSMNLPSPGLPGVVFGSLYPKCLWGDWGVRCVAFCKWDHFYRSYIFLYLFFRLIFSMSLLTSKFVFQVLNLKV